MHYLRTLLNRWRAARARKRALRGMFMQQCALEVISAALRGDKLRSGVVIEWPDRPDDRQLWLRAGTDGAYRIAAAAYAQGAHVRPFEYTETGRMCIGAPLGAAT